MDDAVYDFSWALKQLKSGKKLARKGWNGKKMFLFITKPLLSFSQNIEDYEVPNLPETIQKSICMKTADNKLIVGWLASQTDMLSEDWEIIK
jgi:hypothetical protein